MLCHCAGAGDVASSAGLGLDQAEEAVRALAADSGATLQVRRRPALPCLPTLTLPCAWVVALPGACRHPSNLLPIFSPPAHPPSPPPTRVQVSAAGEIVYVFPSGFQDTIRNKSLLLRLEPTVAGKRRRPRSRRTGSVCGSGRGGVQARGGLGCTPCRVRPAGYPSRSALQLPPPSTCLNPAAAAAVVAAGIKAGAEYLARVAFGTALIVSVVAVYTAITVIATSSSKDNERRGGGFGGGGGLRIFDASDLLWYWDPFYYRHRRERMRQQGGPQGMSFLEAIFSFVFGDGDPNASFDRERWQAVSVPAAAAAAGRCVRCCVGCCLGPWAACRRVRYWLIWSLTRVSCPCPLLPAPAPPSLLLPRLGGSSRRRAAR